VDFRAQRQSSAFKNDSLSGYGTSRKDWWNELCKKTSKEVKQAFPLDVFL